MMSQSFRHSLLRISFSAVIALSAGILCAQVPSITSFSPASGPVGTTVTISGTNFDPVPANNIVWFGAVRATVSSASATSLSVVVPAGANYQPISVTVAGNTAISDKPFIITFLSTRLITSESFAEVDVFPIHANPWDLAIGDLDGDGKPDLIVLYSGPNIMTVWRNTSTSGLIIGGSLVPTDFPVGSYPLFCDIGDLDGDGKLDLVVTNNTGGTVSVFRNTSTIGSISFDPMVDFAVGTSPYDVVIGDIDGDGKPDLAVTDNVSNTVSIFRNTSTPGSITSGSFATKVDFISGSNPSCVDLSDIDGDGKPDLIVNNLNDNTVSLFRNLSSPGTITSGSFASSIDFVTGSRPYGIAVGDLDGDGKPDLAITNNGSGTVSVFRNTSTPGSITSGSLESKVDFTTENDPYGVSIGDIDGDGRPDLAVAFYNAGISVLRNTSVSGSITNSSFAARVVVGAPPGPANIIIGDLDGDGKSDLLSVTNYWPYLAVNQNIIAEPLLPVITSLSPESGPVGTTLTISGNNFSTNAADNIVMFGAVRAEVTTASATELTLTVPAGATYGPISVTVKGYTAWTKKPFDITFPVIRAVDATAFSLSALLQTATYPWNVAIGDIDGDGKSDIAVTNTSSGSVSVYRNTSSSGFISSSSFSGKVDFPTKQTPYGVKLRDIDGDGKLDLVVVSSTDAVITIFRNNSSPGSITTGTFDESIDLPTGSGPRDIDFSDIDGDGKIDIIFQNSTGFAVYHNRSIPGSIVEGSFKERVDFAAMTSSYDVAVSDLDGDGKPDIAVTDNTNNKVSVFRNISSPGIINVSSFESKVDFVTGLGPMEIVIADIDADGKPEMITVNSVGQSVSVFRNTSTPGTINTGSFNGKVDFAAGPSPTYVAIGDINGDTRQDLVVSNYGTNTVSVFKNTSTVGSITPGSFASKVDLAVGAGPVGVAVADFDGDGRPDIAVSNAHNNTVSIIRNRISDPYPPVITSFTPTSGPVGTSVTITGIHFDPTPANNVIWFGSVRATVTTASETNLTVIVPARSTFQPITVTTNGLTGYSAIPFKVTFAGTREIETTTFAPKTDFFAGTGPVGIAYGDIDCDGKPDIVVSNRAVNSISIFRNISTSGSINAESFAPKYEFLSAGLPVGIALGDIDGDGKLDLAIANNSGSVSVIRNTSTPGIIDNTSFGSRVDFATPSGSNEVLIRDIDGDGRPEIIVSNNGINSLSVFHNIGSPGSITSDSFSARFDFTPGINSVGIAVGDIDGDAKPDIVIANNGSNSISILRNTSVEGIIGSMSFAEKVDLNLLSPWGVNLSDIDGDGKLDILVVTPDLHSISVFRNAGLPGVITTGSFESKVDFATLNNPYHISVGDIDCDGKPDVAVSNFGSAMVSLFKNTSSPGPLSSSSLSARYDFASGAGPRGLIIGDIDGDNLPELVSANMSDNTVSVFRNRLSEPPAPVVISFTPTSGPVGTEVTITGTNFSTTLTDNSVSFGAVPATVTAASATQLTINVPAGATTQTISVTVNGFTVNSSSSFTVTIPPVISSFTPALGQVGSTVTINGSNFSSNISNNIVRFGTVQAAVVSATVTQLTVIVPAGAETQSISVTVDGLSAISASIFTVVIPPAITSFTPAFGPVGTTVIIDGANFSTVTTENIVKFGIIQATVTAASTTQLSVTVPTGATTQPVSVTTNGLTATSTTSFAVTIAPIITSFNPVSGTVGTIVTINGANFSTNISADIVKFGTIQASVTSATSTQLTAIVPLNAISAPVSVTVDDLIAYSATSFIVKVPPTITSFTPSSGPAGTTVTINGTNFSSTPADNFVFFGTEQASVISATETLLTAIVPSGAVTQPITINVNGLSTTSLTSFTVTAPPSNPPVITSFNPLSGPVATTVTISGSNFSTNISENIVKFGPVQAAVISANANELTVTVPSGAATNPIYVTVNSLTASSGAPFIVTTAPVITSFSPASGPAGTTVVIAGSDFGPNPADNIVMLGTAQASVVSVTLSQMTVIVPAGATTQLISVTANGLTSYSATPYTVTAPTSVPPVISSFTPASGATGTIVSITGSEFSTVISENIVKFGTVQATVTMATNTQLTVTVPAGAISQPIYVTVNGLTAFTSTSFTVISPPAVTSFSPASGPVGTTVTIEGSNFGPAPIDNVVMFGTVLANVTASTLTQLTVTVPAGAISGPISVTANGLTTTSATTFTVNNPPVIMMFNPASGPMGTTVTITGANFSANISNNIVRFGTAQAAVISATETQLIVIVPASASTQPIFITVNNLTTSSTEPFTVTFLPVISSFNPVSGPIGANVTISGTNFSTHPSDNIVLFGTVPASVISSTGTELTVIVPSGAATQPITVTVSGLSAISSTSFIVTAPPAEIPVVSSFEPQSGTVGVTVTVNGSKFSPSGGDNIVRFGGIQAQILAASSTHLTVIVPYGASSGPITVTVNGQTGNSNTPFMVTPAPYVMQVNPSSGPVGSTVTINGSNFSAEQPQNVVMFGNVQANVISSSQNQLRVTVPNGADGQEIIVNINGYIINTGVYFSVTQVEGLELESAILTLNGDGINEIFRVKNFQAYGQCKFYVFNSRGALVYWDTDFQGEWDVTLHNRRFDTGGYFYVIETSIGTFRGSFSILKN